MLWNQFTASSLDTEDIGFSLSASSPCPVLPMDAQVLGSSGKFTFFTVQLCGHTVFAARNDGQGPIRPVAPSFPDFLSLTLACKGTELLYDAGTMSRRALNREIANKPLTHKQRSILRALRNNFKLSIPEQPLDTIVNAQANVHGECFIFPASVLEQGPAPIETALSDVRFGCGFDSMNHSAPGKRSAVNAAFSWDGNAYLVPAVYACREGIVADVLTRIDTVKILDFIDKWQSLEDSLIPDRQAIMERENPTELRCEMALTLDGQKLPRECAYTKYWNPLGKNGSCETQLVNHYGCDREQGWVFQRLSFRWYKNTKAPLKQLKLHLIPQSVPFPAAPLNNPGAGDSFHLEHPVTGQTHLLTVTKLEDEGFDYNFLSGLPNYGKSLHYTLSPELSDKEFLLRDTAPSDAPTGMDTSQVPQDAALGIIGGADGPVAYFFCPHNKEEGHVALSAFHYAPVESITWQPVFHATLAEKKTVKLL